MLSSRAPKKTSFYQRLSSAFSSSCLMRFIFKLFLYLPFECPCNTELTWMNKLMGLRTNTEAGRCLNVFLPFGLWTKHPAVSGPLTDPQFSCGGSESVGLAMVQPEHLTCPPHGWTMWWEEGTFHVSTPCLQTIPRCYWVWAPPGGWKWRNHT